MNEDRYMDSEGVIRVLTWIKGSYPDFFVDPKVAVNRWLSILHPYKASTVWCTLETMAAQSDALPTPLSLKEACDREIRQKEQREQFREQDERKSMISKQFETVPGKTHFDKIQFVCSERAAEHWKSGNRDDYYHDLLSRARDCGILHDGINYDEIGANTGSVLVSAIMGMARQT